MNNPTPTGTDLRAVCTIMTWDKLLYKCILFIFNVIFSWSIVTGATLSIVTGCVSNLHVSSLSLFVCCRIIIHCGSFCPIKPRDCPAESSGWRLGAAEGAGDGDQTTACPRGYTHTWGTTLTWPRPRGNRDGTMSKLDWQLLLTWKSFDLQIFHDHNKELIWEPEYWEVLLELCPH